MRTRLEFDWEVEVERRRDDREEIFFWELRKRFVC